MTNPDNVGGLPEPVEYQYRYAGCEWQRCGKTYYETLLKHPYDRATLDRMEVRALHDADQMRTYGELCRAAPAGGDDVRRFRGVGELERTGYIPAGSADERDRAPTGGDVDSQRRLHADIIEWEQRVDAGEISASELWGQVRPSLNTLRRLIRDSAPAGSGEVVTDEMVEAGWQSFVRAGVDKRTQNAYVSKTDLRAALEAALLRKLQQGAE